MTRSNLIDIEVMLITKTLLAWLVQVEHPENKQAWIPKSMAELELDPNDPYETFGVLTLPEPLALRKGLI